MILWCSPRLGLELSVGLVCTGEEGVALPIGRREDEGISFVFALCVMGTGTT